MFPQVCRATDKFHRFDNDPERMIRNPPRSFQATVVRMEADLANTARIYNEPAPVADLPGRPIDLVHLAKQTFGERDLEAELLRLFDRQAVQIVARLADTNHGAGRWRADLAHTLKGSARAVGAFGVASAAEAFEQAAVSGADLDAAQHTLATAVAEAQMAIAGLLAG
jgi:HPt (histidine-containing phosphotransfer) domain-containing protein